MDIDEANRKVGRVVSPGCRVPRALAAARDRESRALTTHSGRHFLGLRASAHILGRERAVGPWSGRRCWSLLSGLWRAIAPLMQPWCAEGDFLNFAGIREIARGLA